jgi:hypothetical protein
MTNYKRVKCCKNCQNIQYNKCVQLTCFLDTEKVVELDFICDDYEPTSCVEII